MNHTIVFHLIGVSKELQKAIGFKANNPALSHSQATSLLVINSQDQISQAEIAKRLHLEPATVVTLIDELEKLNLVTRTALKNNRRQYQIKLTKKGKVQAELIQAKANDMDKFIKKQLKGSEAKSFLNSLETLAKSLERKKQDNILKKGGELIELPSA